ncbi:hypothetical protein FQZ97_902620 [compost metagenome]
MGFSTASEFCAADSMPRKAQRVNGMLWVMASLVAIWLGFQAALKISGSNQNQPITDSPATGMITPQTVIDPICPVIFGPPKLARVVSQISTTAPMNRGMAPLPSQGRKGVM